MRLMATSVFLFASLTGVVCQPTAFAEGDQSEALASYPVEVGTEALLRLATEKPLPTYPQAALVDKATGIVVASILVGTNGHMERVKVIESPHPAITDVVQQTLMLWIFQPIKLRGASGPSKIEGKIVLYFDGRSDVGTVRIPARPTNLPNNPAVGAVPGGREITRTDIPRLLREGAILLDVRERRQKVQGEKEEQIGVKIPLSELSTRARTELTATKLVIVDCSSISESQCNGAVHVLGDLGFKDIGVLRQQRQ